MKKFFNYAGVDMGSKELAEKLHLLSQRQGLKPYEKKLLEVCHKIKMKPSVIRHWLEAISVYPEIQKIEVRET
jgi:hypothetical protein